MRNYFLIIIGIIFTLNLSAQWKLENSFKIKGEFVGADIQKNLYFTENAFLIKTNSSGQQLFSYGNINYGNITSADINNPLKLVLFYNDFNYVVFLNNKFSLLREPINLDDLGLSNIEAVCGSQQGGFWLFDANKNNLKYFDSYLNKINESNSFMLINENDEITHIAEFSKYILLAFAESGIFLLDNFAGFIKNLKYNNVEAVSINNENLYLISANKLIIFNLKFGTEKLIDLPEANYDRAYILSDKIYLVINNYLKVYSLL